MDQVNDRWGRDTLVSCQRHGAALAHETPVVFACLYYLLG